MVGSRIVATGCTSGLGLHALWQLIKTAPATLPPPYHIYLLARDPKAAHSLRARDELQALSRALGGEIESDIELREANLSSLSSVRSAAKTISSDIATAQTAAAKHISPGRIDVFLLNAGIAATSKRLVQDRDADLAGEEGLRDDSGRYEETACVNHVSQQLLLAMLLPQLLNREPSRGRPVRVVFTGSALHRKLRTIDDLQTFFDPRREASSSWDMMRSYGASKFLQLLGAQHLVKVIQEGESRGGSSGSIVEVIVVQPGFSPNTGLSRESSLLGRTFMQYVLPRLPFSFITSPEEGGANIAEACYRPLEAFPLVRSADADQDTPSSPWLEEGAPPHHGVRKVLVAKGGEREAPDTRSEDAELARKWWPSVVEREWEAARRGSQM
ncbi:hypothetical protein BDZ90DRAFT_277944 [Jaminaea rosea]|uniref:NAD(P)-binding protein n=1 Tax=Jaminaea rosea TaxID=1569628 RepID=A0A316V2N0_9BASI|nr:hypothetical protein BDZ90DRAFT_277944 [Jaminaea rosea]PWN29685.1 hypothetical protein BDZ90DRAFT_277944 [Jaminaea rosea]